jgi:hypothetical protein
MVTVARASSGESVGKGDKVAVADGIGVEVAVFIGGGVIVGV